MKIKISEGMLKAAMQAQSSYTPTPSSNSTEEALKGALRWQRDDVQPKLDDMLRCCLGDDPHFIYNM